jgi:hypothetical protein
MEFRCLGLPQFGLILIPPSSPEYDGMVADIQRRLDHPVTGSPPLLPAGFQPRIASEDRDTSAVLLNRGQKPVFALTLIWNYVEVSGRFYSHTYTLGVGAFPSLLLPFGMTDHSRRLAGYWHIVLPGSKRYLGAGKMIGDNSDVRPPAPDEMWTGGIAGGGGGGRRMGGPVQFREVTLVIDGVFFTDGQFAGPNQGLLWEQVVSEGEATIQIAQLARQGHFDGLPNERIFATIDEITGPVPERGLSPWPGGRADAESWKRYALGKLATMIAGMRRQTGDARTIYTLSD